MSSEFTSAELMFYNLGLNTPVSRFLAMFTLTEGAIMLFRPPIFYNEEGNAKPWSLFSSEEEDTTLIPFWLPGFIVGGACALFI